MGRLGMPHGVRGGAGRTDFLRGAPAGDAVVCTRCATCSPSLQIFPNTKSVIRLVGALLVEVNDEMIFADRRCIAAGSVATLTDHRRTN